MELAPLELMRLGLQMNFAPTVLLVPMPPGLVIHLALPVLLELTIPRLEIQAARHVKLGTIVRAVRREQCVPQEPDLQLLVPHLQLLALAVLMSISALVAALYASYALAGKLQLDIVREVAALYIVQPVNM